MDILIRIGIQSVNMFLNDLIIICNSTSSRLPNTKILIALLGAITCVMYGCSGEQCSSTTIIHDTIYVENNCIPEGTYTYNLPCKIMSINPQGKGKALLFLWLHGGVHDRPKHNFFTRNHLDCSTGDDVILRYLQIHGIKAIALFPVCYKADSPNTIAWRNCYDDVKHMIDDLIRKNIIDSNRIYVAGSSDGGAGTWDYAAMHPEMFAAALPLSCGNPQYTTIPVYFFNTSTERDRTNEVQNLNQRGCNIKYKHCVQYTHERDANECTDELLDEFFSHIKQ